MQVTKLGYQARLKRRSNITIYDKAIDEVGLDVEFQTEDRLRFKVIDQVLQSCVTPIARAQCLKSVRPKDKSND